MCLNFGYTLEEVFCWVGEVESEAEPISLGMEGGWWFVCFFFEGSLLTLILFTVGGGFPSTQ